MAETGARSGKIKAGHYICYGYEIQRKPNKTGLMRWHVSPQTNNKSPAPLRQEFLTLGDAQAYCRRTS